MSAVYMIHPTHILNWTFPIFVYLRFLLLSFIILISSMFLSDVWIQLFKEAFRNDLRVFNVIWRERFYSQLKVLSFMLIMGLILQCIIILMRWRSSLLLDNRTFPLKLVEPQRIIFAPCSLLIAISTVKNMQCWRH